MVKTNVLNDAPPATLANPEVVGDYHLPDIIEITTAEARRIPSPGAQRALKAQTGKSYDQLAGPQADSADRVQTMIWMKLRREFPAVRWDDCAEVTVQVEEGALDTDPTVLVGSGTWPDSVDSGE